MSVKVLQDQDFGGVARLTNLPSPAAGGDAARLQDLQQAIEGLAWKDAVRVKTQGNVNLAAPGATVDGVTMNANDRFLAASQTTTSQNGIYVWTGAATPATRAVDANTFAELEGATVSVTAGTDTGTTWRQTQVGGTIDTDPVAFTAFGTAAPAASETTAGIAEAATQGEVDAGTAGFTFVRPATLAAWAGRANKYQANIGDNAATQFTVTHNLNTRDVLVQVVRNASPYDNVVVDVERSSVNAVVLRFASAPTTDQFRALIIG